MSLLPRSPLAATFLALALVGCGSGKGSVDGEGDDAGSDGSDGADGGELTGEDPVVVSATIYCEIGSKSSGNLFIVEVRADDPQGTWTLSDFGGTFTAYELDGEVVFQDEGLACRDGLCNHSFTEYAVAPVSCATQADYIFTVTVEDDDGNVSEEAEVEWTG